MLDPSAKSLVEALESDPFYDAIASGSDVDADKRRQRLAQYFSYSLEEAKALGRTVYLQDQTLGASAWLLPANEQSESAAVARKHAFLSDCLGKTVCATMRSGSADGKTVCATMRSGCADAGMAFGHIRPS